MERCSRANSPARQRTANSAGLEPLGAIPEVPLANTRAFSCQWTELNARALSPPPSQAHRDLFALHLCNSYYHIYTALTEDELHGYE